MNDLAPLLAIPFASLLLWRLGARGVAWILPLAVGLLWCVHLGLGRHALVIGGTALTSALTLGFALQRVAASFKSSPSGEDAGELNAGPALFERAARTGSQDIPHSGFENDLTDPEHSTSTELFAAPTADGDPPLAWKRVVDEAAPSEPETYPAPAALDPSPAAPAGEASTPVYDFPSASRAKVDTARRKPLIEAIADAATELQRATIIDELQSPDEHLALLRDPQAPSMERGLHPSAPTVATARTSVREQWGSALPEGVLVSFEGTAPGQATVLAVLCDIADEAGLLAAGTHEGRVDTHALVLIPTDLDAVKRLDGADDPGARWVAKEVFVPLHLVVGEYEGVGLGLAIIEHSTF